MTDMEVEEVEEEDPDVHFKRKQQGESRRKRLVKKARRYTPAVIAEGESAAVPPLASLVIKLSALRQTVDKVVPDLSKISSILAIYTYIYFMQLIRLSYDSRSETAREPRTEAVGEQGDYYDPLFTYKEGNEASYFVVLEDSEGDEADIGPSGVGTSKGSPWPPAL